MSFRGSNINDLPKDSDSDSSLSDNDPLINLVKKSSISKSKKKFQLKPSALNIIKDTFQSTLTTTNNSATSTSNSASNSNTNVTMALKSEYLNMIPEFNGEQQLLPRFIEICEKLVNKFYNTEDENDFQNEYLMSSILAKIKGKAAINISSNIIRTWDDLKLALLNTYSDKRDVYTLNLELAELRQNNNESPFEFFHKVQHLLNLQITYLTNKIVPAEREILAQFCKNVAVRVFLRGLKEPLGSLMRTKKPDDLNQALNIMTNDFNLEYKQKSNQRQSICNHYNPIMNRPNHNPTISKPSNQNLNLRPQFSNFRPYNQQNQFSNQYRQNNNYNSSNVFRPNQINPRTLPKQTPMSVTTRNTQQSLNNPNPYNQYKFNQNKPPKIPEESYNMCDHPIGEFSQTNPNFDDSENQDSTENPEYPEYPEVPENNCDPLENDHFLCDPASNQDFQELS